MTKSSNTFLKSNIVGYRLLSYRCTNDGAFAYDKKHKSYVNGIKNIIEKGKTEYRQVDNKKNYNNNNHQTNENYSESDSDSDSDSNMESDSTSDNSCKTYLLDFNQYDDNYDSTNNEITAIEEDDIIETRNGKNKYFK